MLYVSVSGLGMPLDSAECAHFRKPVGYVCPNEPVIWSYMGKSGMSARDPSSVWRPGWRKSWSASSVSFSQGIAKKSASYIVQSACAAVFEDIIWSRVRESGPCVALSECAEPISSASTPASSAGSRPNSCEEACFRCDRRRVSRSLTCLTMVFSSDCTISEYCRACGSTLAK